MRLVVWLPLCALLWAAAAVAQPANPEIKDPDGPNADEVNWELALEENIALSTASPLAEPVSALVFIGTKQIEEFFVLEKHTGRVRHFRERADQGDALNLSVDTCSDERGLIGLALHPLFEREPHDADPEHPEQDWVYVSYHSSAGGACPTAATFHVVRYTWNGSTLVNPVPMYTKSLSATELTSLGGFIATTLEVQLVAPITFVPRLYILLGSFGRNGKLQNNPNGADLDDTSVLLRLTEDGETPDDNPLDDPDTDAEETKDRYFAYGFGAPRGIAVDAAAQTIWFTERSDPDGAVEKPDEINLMFGASNGGYRHYQGCAEGDCVNGKIPDNLENGEPNPDYKLFDLATTDRPDPADEEPVSTYLNPRFTFEDKSFEPTGVAFGGTEVGPQHRGDLFVGTRKGDLYRFHVEPFRTGFELVAPLNDVIAQDDEPTADPPRVADDLKDIWIAEGFHAIVDVEEDSDGAIWVVQEDGGLHRVFFDADRDIAIQSVKAPAKISISAKKMVVSKSIRLTLLNFGEVAERIDSHDDLMRLLGMQITPIGPASCAPLDFDVIDPKYVSPPYSYPIGMRPKNGKLTLEVSVEWTCDNGANPAPVAGEFDFDTQIHLDPAAIGVPELPAAEANNDCPRPAVGNDPGCGGKGGGPIVTDVIEK
jgi:glucose/arabinose dehydrogenase